MRRLPEMDDRSAELVEELTRSLVNKLLHHPVVRLRKEARKDSAEDYNQAIRYLFALSESS
jgi:glutamyl-tRNA reductase